MKMNSFDWHAAPISRATATTKSCRNTRNVRRFFIKQCGGGVEKTMGDAADEWLRREAAKRR
jgi:hypothetical protein